MDNSGQFGGDTLIDIGLLGAWEFTTGSSDVVVAIVQDNANSSHTDFIPATGSNRISQDGINDPNDHGTLIAGIIAAEANNGTGIAGIDQHCAVWCVDEDHGQFPWQCHLCTDIKSAANAGVDIMNYSHGWPDPGFDYASAFAYAYNKGVLIVASTGNDDSGVWQYPAGFDWVIAVGGLRITGVRAGHSNYGAHVDLVAPDGDTIFAHERWITSLLPPSGYTTVKGTSYACAHVVGAASLLLGAHPELSNDDIANVLELSAYDIDPPGRDDGNGYGLVKIDSALRILELPNKLIQWSGEPTVYDVTNGKYWMNLENGTGIYVGDKYELRRTVTFEKRYYDLIKVWTRGSSSLGVKDSSGMYPVHHTEFVPGTLTDTSVVLRTYVYYVVDLAGEQDAFWLPCRPEDAIVSYGILGEELLVTPPLSGTVQSDRDHLITWPDLLDFESNWHVDRKDGDGPWQTDYAVLPENSTYFTDPGDGLPGSELYQYRIYPSSSHQTGSTSNLVSITTRPNPPVNTEASVIYSLGDLIPLGGPEGGEMMTMGMEGGDPGGPVPTTEVDVAWPPPLNQANPPAHYRIEAWRYGEYHTVEPCWATNCCPCRNIEVFDSISSTSARICLDLPTHLYEIQVYAVGEDGQISLPGNAVLLGTGGTDLCNDHPCDPLYDPHCVLPPDQKLAAVPHRFALGENFPNPFNASTVVRFSTARYGLATLDIFNVLGQQVARLLEEQLPPGVHQVEWDGQDWSGQSVPSGVYLYRLQADAQAATKKMVLLK